MLPSGQPKTDDRKFFFSQRVVDKWNHLPDSVKQADTVNTFKNRLDDIMFPRARARWGHHSTQVPAQMNDLVTP